MQGDNIVVINAMACVSVGHLWMRELAQLRQGEFRQWTAIHGIVRRLAVLTTLVVTRTPRPVCWQLRSTLCRWPPCRGALLALEFWHVAMHVAMHVFWIPACMPVCMLIQWIASPSMLARCAVFVIGQEFGTCVHEKRPRLVDIKEWSQPQIAVAWFLERAHHAEAHCSRQSFNVMAMRSQLWIQRIHP
jgi:hypothetical protein